jgi:peptide methionine sulfoxide reductase msrA/msrB
MYRYLFIIAIAIILFVSWTYVRTHKEGEGSMSSQTYDQSEYIPLDERLLRPLSSAEADVIINKGTEWAFRGEYTDLEAEGTYYCKWCDAPLYTSESKFHSGCGWPSFDDEIPNSVLRIPDADGMRTEIVCASCGGHLGHVFEGERFTEKDTRHCVNSISLVFKEGPPVAKAVFAGGCFWGVEYLFESLEGVYSAVSGYSSGTLENPTYEAVLSGRTGHLEAVEISYNPLVVSYEQLARYFFEIHDPTQRDGQGPDIGEQYLSAIFYRSKSEYDTALRLIGILEEKGLSIATTLRPAAPFWVAEQYHQDYYERKGTLPYCHAYIKRF